ncbi:MAG: bifunctional diguanylate cyclase/phosphodiesterase [Pseudomonadota bacterium]
MTQTLVAAALATILVAMFIGVSLAANAIRADRISQQQTQAYADLAAVHMSSGQIDVLSRALNRHTGGRFALIGEDGALIAGDASLLNARGTNQAPVGFEGTVLGTLVTHRLVPFSIPIPWQILVALVAVSITTSFLVGRFYTRRVLSGLNSISLAFSDTASGSTSSPQTTFTEFTRLRLQIQRRIRDLHRTAKHLETAAYENPDSGLPNLRAFHEAANTQLAEADFNSPFCIIRINVDHFQRASDLAGLEKAQSLLKLTTDRISEELLEQQKAGCLDAERCLLTHLQGDDFALLLPVGAGKDVAGQIARNLRRAFVAPFNISGRWVSLGLSGGIVAAPEDGDQVNTLLRRADAALRSLRNDKREGFAFYQSRLDRVAEQRFALESDVRKAVEQKIFRPAFQAKINLETGAISGCEALARWPKDDGTFVSPGAFIPIAEQSGLIVEIGDLIMRQACAAAAGWVADGFHVPVAVNVSAAQLDDPTFCDRVLDAIADTGLRPELLELEITESMAVTDPAHVEAVLKPLRKMGVRVAIDDFGTGHANLSILTRLNFDVFKIDRSFVSGVVTDPSAAAIVDMILAMAHTLKHDTVAEGIETAEQAAFFRDRGCTCGQGFHYARPLDEARFRKLLRSRPGLSAPFEQRKRA